MLSKQKIINILLPQLLPIINPLNKHQLSSNFFTQHSFLYYRFSSQKSYTSTFKIRSRLSQFFKHVHPDQLTHAPTKVKQQNLRSLTNFNSYIDSISQSKPIQAKLLKFYIAQKNNLKSKKFFSFTVQLPQMKNNGSQYNEQKTKKLVDNIVDVLNKKFQQSKNFKTKHGKISDNQKIKVDDIKIVDNQTESQRFDRMTAKINPFNKKNSINQAQQSMLKKSLNKKYMQVQKQSLQDKLRKSISFANTGRNKPLFWQKLANKQSGIYKDYQKIMDQLIDPRLIYFDQTLTLTQIQQFKKRLLPGQLNRQSYKNSKIILQICSKMQSFQPPLCFYVTHKYSSKQIPGFISIPYNFNPKQLASYFQKQIDTVLQQQQKYEQYYDYYNQLKNQLSRENNLYVDEVNFKNNQEIWARILMLKRLQKYKYEGSGRGVGVVGFQKDTFTVFMDKYGYGTNNSSNTKSNINKQQDKQKRLPLSAVLHEGKIICRIDFADIDIQNIIKHLSNQHQSININSSSTIK